MQGWEDYEADYFRREPERYYRDDEDDDRGWGLQRDERLCPVDRQGRRRCMDAPRMNRDWMNGQDENRWRQPGTMPEESDQWMIRDMDEFEALMGAVGRELLRIIRRMCDSMDGDGCIAMDGTMTGELKDMLVDRVMDEMEDKGTDMRDDDTLRELIAQLLFQELLRRRHRRRQGKRRPPVENPRKRLQF